jgi:hypothetical protein
MSRPKTFQRKDVFILLVLAAVAAMTVFLTIGKKSEAKSSASWVLEADVR